MTTYKTIDEIRKDIELVESMKPGMSPESFRVLLDVIKEHIDVEKRLPLTIQDPKVLDVLDYSMRYSLNWLIQKHEDELTRQQLETIWNFVEKEQKKELPIGIHEEVEQLLETEKTCSDKINRILYIVKMSGDTETYEELQTIVTNKRVLS